MSDLPVVEEAEETVEEIVEPPEVEESSSEPDGKPPWADEIIAAVDSLASQVAALTPIPNENTEGDDGPRGDDDDPVGIPWTAKKLF